MKLLLTIFFATFLLASRSAHAGVPCYTGDDSYLCEEPSHDKGEAPPPPVGGGELGGTPSNADTSKAKENTGVPCYTGDDSYLCK